MCIVGAGARPHNPPFEQVLLTSDLLEVNRYEPHDGNTALHVACSHGSSECVKALLAADGLQVCVCLWVGRRRAWRACVCVHVCCS